ncbi:MAG: GHMP family kinase ATP-binding protein [Candidatus Helarchaeota archaeon]
MLIRSKAPLRISFAGGGTDVPPFPEKEGGCVLNATINKYAYGSLKPRNDGIIQIESLDFGFSTNYNVNEILVYDGKLDLVKAAIHKLGGQESSGFDLFLHSDAPPGSGLGSSSTMMVALVGLLKEFKNLPFTEYEIAHMAYIIERKELGIKGGLQDQYAATFGSFNFIEFYKDRVIVNPLKIRQDCINELEHNLLLCYTGKTRLSDRIIEDQTKRYKQNESDTLEGLRKQKELAIEMKNALLQRRFNHFGELLHYAWQFKKKMSPKISNQFIDEMYEIARKAGALGGKITGAGGGGYMLFYCFFERKHKVAEALMKLGASITDFAFEFNGLQTWQIVNG